MSLQAATLPAHVTPLVDATDRARRGGTGTARELAARRGALAPRRPIMLAGGLTPENVGDAIRHVQPWAA